MELSVTSIKANMIIPIGSLSSKRAEVIDLILRDIYPVRQSVGDAIVYINTNARSSVVVGANQIGFGIGNPNSDFKNYAQQWQEISSKIMDQLLLDPTCKGMEIDLMGIM